jgi:FkbM family methyltransferase
VSVVQGTSALVGRRRAVRAARFATNVLRFDDGNTIDSNGEMLVQRVARSRPDPVIFDVGANVGQWSTALLAQPGHQPLLHLFEPASYSYARAVEAMGQRARVHALALSSEAGEAELQIVKPGAGVNSLVRVDQGTGPTTTETVRVDTVDRFCHEHGIDELTLLKIDAEGHDLSVLRGAAGMFERGVIGIAQFEYNWRWVFSRTYLKDVFDFVGELPRYSLAKVTPKAIEFYDRWHPELESFRESNYLLVRDDWRASFPVVEWWGG